MQIDVTFKVEGGMPEEGSLEIKPWSTEPAIADAFPWTHSFGIDVINGTGADVTISGVSVAKTFQDGLGVDSLLVNLRDAEGVVSAGQTRTIWIDVEAMAPIKVGSFYQLKVTGVVA